VVMLFAMPMQSVQKGMSSLTCTAYGCLCIRTRDMHVL
jgi:hypothetical protein